MRGPPSDSSTMSASKDAIRINDLLLTVSLLSGACWVKTNTPVEQVVSVSLSIFHNVSAAAETDDLSLSLDYSVIAKGIRNFAHGSSKSFDSLRDLSRHLSDALSTLLPVGVLNKGGFLEVHLKVVQLKSPLHTRSVGIEHDLKYHSDGSWIPSKVAYFVEDLVCPAIIGVNPQERVEKQDVVVNLVIDTRDWGLDDGEEVNLRLITKSLYEGICSSSYQTLEALTSFVATQALTLVPDQRNSAGVFVRAAKPSALVFATSAEVQLHRTIDDPKEKKFPSKLIQPQNCSPSLRHTAAIAFGSNLGDSFHNIEYALRLLEGDLSEILNVGDNSISADTFVEIVDTSFLYETQPMYVEDQPSFINGACIIETSLLPLALLRLLKAIERKVGRVPSPIRNGPRAVDLDVIFYDDRVIDTREGEGGTVKDRDNLEGHLVVPHPRMQEREFVLRPLNDIIPDYIHPIFKKNISALLLEIPNLQNIPMTKVIPFPQLPSPTTSIPNFPSSTLLSWSYTSDFPPPPPRKTQLTQKLSQTRTHIMATLNTTPDSFSDGGEYTTLSTALSYVSSSILAGASIIDIGGYSTRPGAEYVGVEEETRRVVDVVELLRDKERLKTQLADLWDGDGTWEQGEGGGEALRNHVETILSTPISIDTFRWEVAEAAIRAGANCINDVYAFTGPDSWPLGEKDEAAKRHMEKMKDLSRKYAVPVVLMHSRGDAGSNKDYSSFNYASDRGGGGKLITEAIRVELGAKVNQIVTGKGGVRRWLAIVDPGIGFSKTLNGNLEVLRCANEIVEDRMIGDACPYKNPLRNFPLLIGPSRKSFLSEVLVLTSPPRKTQPKDRIYATAAAVTSAVQQDALVVRVHDVGEMVDVVKVAEALWG